MKTNQRRVWMIGSAAAATAAGLGLALWRSAPKAGTATSANQNTGPNSLWSQRFERPAGGDLVMAELRGKPVLLNFWATWCAPCVAEMPMLDAFQRDHAAQGWQVVGLAVDNPEPVRDFVAKRQIGFAIGLVGFAGADLARDFGNTSGSLPFSVVFGRDGQPKHQKLGALKPEDLASWVKSVG